jgi:hypothetical protein
MKNAIFLGLFAAMVATSASASKFVEYQLLDNTGSPLCETVLVTQDKDGTATGNVTGCGLKDPTGGLYGGVRKVSGTSWTFVWREPEIDSANTQYTVVLDEKSMTWTTFSQVDGTRPYAFLASGTLGSVNTPARSDRSLASIAKAAQHARPATGVDVHYTFAQSDGTPYCDGLTLTQSAMLATGTHTASSSCTEGTYAGGNFGHVKAVGEKVWTITTTDAAQPDVDLIYVVDEDAMTWSMYAQWKGFITFHLVSNGKLLAGDPEGSGQTTFSSLQ